jgi:ABC-type lipoprotein export system ATPase subunit
LAHENGAAVLLVTHDIEAAAKADRRCTLRDGRLSDGHPGVEGPPGEGRPGAEGPAGGSKREATGDELLAR